jgi:hypothetical protein
MNENEVIIVDSIPDNEYDSVIEKCVKYALISLPFTVDRMAIPNEKQRALNIAKGKIAEELFKCFCRANNIQPDFDSCSTEFWTIDNRDFIINQNEWDIKNNFIYTETDLLDGNYTNLPALVPNRFNGDQWSKRAHNLIAGTNGVAFLFTYLKNASLNNGTRGFEFLEINLSNNQQNYLRELYGEYRGNPQTSEPFSEGLFWEEMAKRGNMNFYTLHFKPYLIITGYANSSNWQQFRDTGPYDRNNNWQTYLQPRWYTKTAKGSCNFMNGALWTTITNATLPVSQLNSFFSLFPHLRNQMNYGKLKQ